MSEHPAERDAPWRAIEPSGTAARGEPRESCDVLVIGAGISGLTTALLLARAGRDVGVLEADDVAAGTTGRSTAKATVLQSVRLSELAAQHSKDVVLGYAQAHEQARQWMEQTCSELSVPHSHAAAWTYATTSDGADQVRTEQRLLRDAGFDAELTHETELPFPVREAVRLDGQLQVDPRAYCSALAGDLEAVGGWLWTDARAVAVRGRQGPHEVAVRTSSSEHVVRAATVVVATGSPILDRGLFFARLRPERSYSLALTLTTAPPEGMYISVESPKRSLRTGTTPRQLLVGGDGHQVAHGPAESEHYEALEAWSRKHFKVRRVAHAWAAQDYHPPDGLPYVGPLVPGSSSLWVTTGFAKWGITGGTAGGQALTALIQGDGSAPPGWEPWRMGSLSAAAEVLRLNAGVAAELAVGWAKAATREPSRPADGHGIVYRQGARVAAACTVDGVTRTVSGVCTHLGGTLRWNEGDASWDCPLHGSRFGPDGAVLCGPATRPLAKRDDEG